MERSPRILSVNADLVGGGLLLAVGVIALIYARGATFNVWIFPRVAAVSLVIIGAGLLVKGSVTPERRELLDAQTAVTTVLPFAAGIVAYALLFSRVGFVPTTTVLYAAATWVLRREFTVRSAIVSLAIGAAFTLVLHGVFTRVFYVPLPEGSWWGR
jgi:hypothetical protein